MKKLKIGLFGFGVVGEGIYNVLTSKQHLGIDVAKIVIKDETKTRNAPTELFSTQAYDILNDDSIDLVVELIDDADAAFAIVQTALKRGKSVVSANKTSSSRVAYTSSILSGVTIIHSTSRNLS